MNYNIMEAFSYANEVHQTENQQQFPLKFENNFWNWSSLTIWS